MDSEKAERNATRGKATNKGLRVKRGREMLEFSNSCRFAPAFPSFAPRLISPIFECSVVGGPIVDGQVPQGVVVRGRDDCLGSYFANILTVGDIKQL